MVQRSSKVIRKECKFDGSRLSQVLKSHIDEKKDRVMVRRMDVEDNRENKTGRLAAYSKT
jgi:hypothetical protein